jgi:hypothetical protein
MTDGIELVLLAYANSPDVHDFGSTSEETFGPSHCLSVADFVDADSFVKNTLARGVSWSNRQVVVDIYDPLFLLFPVYT